MFNIGLLCMEQGRVQEAANWYRKAVARKPSSAEALFQFGTALHKLGELQGETPRREEKSAQQIAIEEEEKKRAEDEREAKKAAEHAEELGNLTKEDYRAHDLPNEPVHHPSPPWETVDRVAEVETEETQKQSMKAMAIAAMAAEKLKGVGSSYAAYLSMRAAHGADVGESGDDTASEASPGPSSRGLSRAASQERDLAKAIEDKDAALSSKAAQALAGIATPASRSSVPRPARSGQIPLQHQFQGWNDALPQERHVGAQRRAHGRQGEGGSRGDPRIAHRDVRRRVQGREHAGVLHQRDGHRARHPPGARAHRRL